MMNKIHCAVKGLVMKELGLARRINGDYFNSTHEGYGVIAEELDEARHEDWKAGIATDRLLRAIRSDNASKLKGPLWEIEKRATLAACEYIQVAAMARKMRESIEEVKA